MTMPSKIYAASPRRFQFVNQPKYGDLNSLADQTCLPDSICHAAGFQKSVSQPRFSHTGTFGGKGASAVGIQLPIFCSLSRSGMPNPTIAATVTNVSWKAAVNRSDGRQNSTTS